MSNHLMRYTLAMLAALVAVPLSLAWACPFCSAVSQTLSEEMKTADAAVIVKQVALPAKTAATAPAKVDKSANPFAGDEPSKTKFEIVQVLKGEKLLGKTRQIEILYFGQQPPETKFLVMGTDPKDIAWSTPTPLSERAVKYVAQLPKLPETGPDRLVFFQDYFEDQDSLLNGDAYDEFAKAPYADVQQIKAKMQREKLLDWIQDPQAPASHRRLYLTMLGICGGPDDLSTLEAMIRNDARPIRQTLDALLACYLNIKGPAGMTLVEDLFLKNKKAEYVDTYAAIMALRFHGQETTVVTKERLAEGMRHMLDRPQLADLVIADLARWEDWSCMERLVKLFKDSVTQAKEAEKDTGEKKVNADLAWIRVPVVNYLRACPLPAAAAHLDELKKLDPDSVKSANQFFPLSSPAKAPKSSVRPKTDPAAGAPPAEVTPVEKPAPKNRAAATPLEDPVAQAVIEQAPTPGESSTAETVITLKPVVAGTPQVVAAGPAQRSAATVVEKVQATAGTVLLWSAAAAAGLTLVLVMILRGDRRPGMN